ncbi:MAG: hypothetical protein JWQ02_2767 [Capsulimonas sp.]|nr:hypothetical protein [Capsulimonas sp.]
MYLIHGQYRWKKQRIAYRGDYCLTCEGPRLAEQIRSFDVGHLYFIPILPLGYRNHWHCSACGNDPHARTRTSKALLVVLAVVIVLFSALGWLSGPFIPVQDAAAIWAIRLIPLAISAAIVVWVVKTPPILGLKELLQTVPPTPVDQCLYCQGALDRDGFCANCKMRRIQLDQSFALMR